QRAAALQDLAASRRVNGEGVALGLKMRRASWLLLFLAILFAAGAPMFAGELRVGAATANINPPLGAPLAGYYYERSCDGVLDDLFAKAMVLDDGQTKAALVVCDLVTLPRSVALEARR